MAEIKKIKILSKVKDGTTAKDNKPFVVLKIERDEGGRIYEGEAISFSTRILEHIGKEAVDVSWYVTDNGAVFIRMPDEGKSGGGKGGYMSDETKIKLENLKQSSIEKQTSAKLAMDYLGYTLKFLEMKKAAGLKVDLDVMPNWAYIAEDVLAWFKDKKKEEKEEK